MRRNIFILFLIAIAETVSAQVVITVGASLYLPGNAQFTLRDIDLINDGNFASGNSTVSFTGSASTAISGGQPLQFYSLEVNKTSGGSIALQRMIGVSQNIVFASGNIDLNGFDIDLGTTGSLIGEQESSRITGSNGGHVLFNTTLNAPNAFNPGNLGAVLTSAQDLGTVTIKRGHRSQVNASGMGNSILRYYDISPANNNSLN